MTRNHWSSLIFLGLVGSFVAAPDANAIIGVAPGGSVVRRHAIVATTAVVASESAAAATPAAPAPATAPAPAPAPAAAAAPAPATAGTVAIGTVVAALPAGCTPQPVGDVNYYKCGTTYYQAAFQGTSLVYVSVAPPK